LREHKLIKGCLKGKATHQRELYETFKVSMFMLCLRYMPTREDAEDVLQEGFVKVFRDLHQFDRKRGKLKTWMSRVMVNTALEHLRKQKSIFETVEVSTLSELHAVEDDIFAELSTQELMRLVQELPLGYRIVFNMHVVEGYTHQDIAKQLDISPNTSKSQLFKAKAMLRKKVKKLYSIAVDGYGRQEI